MDKIEAKCSCGATLTIQTDFSLEMIIKAVFLWQQLHAACRQAQQLQAVSR
jgi:hypothetical protein